MAFDSRKSEQIWNTILRVPRGRVAAYGFIADLAGLPGRARLVGSVLGMAPPELHLPWQRILRSNGLIAFASGSDRARLQVELLRQEGVEVLNHRVNMMRYGWKPALAELMQMHY